MIHVARAEKTDLSSILEIQRSAFRSEAELCGDPNIPPLTQTQAEIEKEFEKKIFLKAVDGTKIVGSVRGQMVGYSCLIGRLVVDPAHQHKGIGTSLLTEIESTFPKACLFELFTSDKSEANLKFYEQNGYHPFKTENLTPKVTIVHLEKGIR